MKAILFVLALSIPSMAFATPMFMNEFKTTHKDEKVSCATCHVGAPKEKKLTKVGTEFKKTHEAKAK